MQEKKATVTAKDSLEVNSTNKTKGLVDSDNEKLVNSKVIANNIEMKNKTTDSEWMEIKKLLDSDAYSIPNEKRNSQLINSSNLNDVFYDDLSLEENDNMDNTMAGSRRHVVNTSVSTDNNQTLSSISTLNQTMSDLKKAIQKDLAQHDIKNNSKIISSNRSLIIIFNNDTNGVLGPNEIKAVKGISDNVSLANDTNGVLGPNTVNKSAMNQNDTKVEGLNETSVLLNVSDITPTTNASTERINTNDTKVNGSMISGLNIVEIQMLSTDVPSHGISRSKRLNRYTFGTNHHKGLIYSNSIQRKTMKNTSIKRQKRFKVSNRNKKHRIVSHSGTRNRVKYLTTNLTKRYKIARNDAKSWVALPYHENMDVKKKESITAASHHKRKHIPTSKKFKIRKSKSKRRKHSKGMATKVSKQVHN